MRSADITMDQLGHLPANSTLINQAPTEFNPSLNLTSRFSDTPSSSSSAHARLLTEYYLPNTTSVEGYHPTSLQLPSIATTYPKPQPDSPVHQLYHHQTHNFPNHQLKTHTTPPSASSISSIHIQPDGLGNLGFHQHFHGFSQPRESECSSDCSSPEYEKKLNKTEYSYSNHTDLDLVKEDFENLSANEDGIGTAHYPYSDHHHHHHHHHHHDESLRDNLGKRFRGSSYAQEDLQDRPRVTTDHEEEKQSDDASTVTPAADSKLGAKKGASAKVSEKRRQQNRAAQRAMRERRKRAAQHQELHMTAILTENAHLREKVAYLSNLLLTHPIAQPPAQLEPSNPSLTKHLPVLSPLDTTNLQRNSSLSSDSSPQQNSLVGTLPPSTSYTIPGTGPYSFSTGTNALINVGPTSPYQVQYLPHQASSGSFAHQNISGTSSASSSSNFSRPGTSDEGRPPPAALEARHCQLLSSGWNAHERNRFRLLRPAADDEDSPLSVPLSSRQIGFGGVGNDHGSHKTNTTTTSSTVPSPTTTEEHSY